MTQPDLDALAQRILRFADQECGTYAPLYDRLARGIAGDADLLALAAQARPGQQVPLGLLAAVHALLLGGADHALGAWYPSVRLQAALPTADPFPAFQSFCQEHRDTVRALVSKGLVQTNEPRRCAALLPAFASVARLAGGRPLALIDVGASAGLNLLFDRYGYDYGAGRRVGDTAAPIQFACTVRGAIPPPLPAVLPQVVTRIGIDLHPIRADDLQATRWLRALVWPEHVERAAILQQALTLARDASLTLLTGDALTVLPQAVAMAPVDAALCVFHIATLGHFPLDARERFRTLIVELAHQRDLFWLSSEGIGLGAQRRQGEYAMRLTMFQRRRQTERLLAYQHPHGAWLEWHDRNVKS